MENFVSPKGEIWFLRVFHHFSKAVYQMGLSGSHASRSSYFLEGDIQLFVTACNRKYFLKSFYQKINQLHEEAAFKT
jgi:hypothetical protein